MAEPELGRGSDVGGQQIVALGGGGFSMEETPVLDDFILGLTGKPDPGICFLATASGDNENYIVRFYRRFNQTASRPTHLELFRRDGRDLGEFAESQDVIYVGGGNTANMLAVWRLHGFDRALNRALEAGTILAGVSAGSVCWFEAGVTDSYGPRLQPLDCLGFLSGSHCPHYDGEEARRPAYHRLVAAGLPAGIAADDGAALHYADGRLQGVVASRHGARAYRVQLEDGSVRESPIEAKLLA